MQPRELDKQAAIEGHHWWFKARRRLLKSGFKFSLERTQAEILEIGAASGGNYSVCRQFGNYHALDLSTYALDICRRKGIVNRIHSDACSIPRDAKSFDVVVAFDILEHIEEDICGKLLLLLI